MTWHFVGDIHFLSTTLCGWVRFILHRPKRRETSEDDDSLELRRDSHAVNNAANHVPCDIKRNGIHMALAYQPPTLTHVPFHTESRLFMQSTNSSSFAFYCAQFPHSNVGVRPIFAGVSLNFPYHRIQYSECNWCEKSNILRSVEMRTAVMKSASNYSNACSSL